MHDADRELLARLAAMRRFFASGLKVRLVCAWREGDTSFADELRAIAEPVHQLAQDCLDRAEEIIANPADGGKRGSGPDHTVESLRRMGANVREQVGEGTLSADSGAELLDRLDGLAERLA